MGWTQTREAPTQRENNAAGVGSGVENIEMAMPFLAATAARTAFVMTDELLRHGLMHVLSQAAGVRPVGDLQHGPGLTAQLRELRADLLVIGPELGPHLPALLSELDPAPKVLAVIDGDNPRERALSMVVAGADAVVDRRSSAAELRAAILRVVDGHRALDARSADTLISELREQADPGASSPLTRREREVLDLLVNGLDNRAIAGSLFISQATVKFHLHNIKTKFGVHSRAALVAMALRPRDHG